MLKVDDIVYDNESQEYRIIRPIGQGGMGYILLIERVKDKVTFALKTLPPIFLEGGHEYDALINEGRLAESINHKNVIKYIFFHSGEKYPNLPPYIIMELADQDNLSHIISEHISTGDFLASDDLLSLYLKLVNGISAVNEVLVHRDLKPSNILFIDGEPKISDFGISKIAGDPTRTNSFKGSGTISYMAPEVFLNKSNTIQMDVYSMGVIFYLLATLKHPYEVVQKLTTEEDWKKAHLSMSVQPAHSLYKELSPKISAVIQKMLEKDPKKRFTSWEDVKKDLENVVTLEDKTYSPAIQKIISRDLERKVQAQTVETERLEKENTERERVGMIIYQFKNDIIKPVEEFKEQFNSVTINVADHCTVTSDVPIQKFGLMKQPRIKDISYIINLPTLETRVEVYLHIINENDYRTARVEGHFGDTYNKNFVPKLNGENIVAWGAVEDNKESGFNLVLSKKDGESYGSWFILKNTHSGMVPRQDSRPDPFPFSLHELVTEIDLITSFHIFHTQVLPYSENHIIDLLSDS